MIIGGNDPHGLNLDDLQVAQLLSYSTKGFGMKSIIVSNFKCADSIWGSIVNQLGF